LSSSDTLVVHVNGAEFALLVASTFIMIGWAYERRSAQMLVSEEARRRVDKVNDRISEQARKAWKDAGIWESPTRLWTPDLIARRSAIKGKLVLERDELRDTELALRAAYAEFLDNWDEFCVATPGNLDWYTVGPQDIVDLADKLNRALAQSGNPG
jgi:hypothetical protein